MGLSPNSVAVADLNGDGLRDVAVVDSVLVSILTNKGSSGLALTSSIELGGVALVAADFDGNSQPDLAIATGTDLAVLLNVGTVNAAPASHYETGAGPWGLAAGDLDGDGTQDLVVANSADDTLTVLKNEGHGTFGKATQLSTGSHPNAVVLADLNGDGKLDAATSDFFAATLSVFTNQGSAVFAPAVSLPSGPSPTALAAGDLTGDGRVDLVISNEDDHVSILVNQGNMTFASGVREAVGTTPYGITLANVLGDGALDIVTANYNGGVTILRNDGASHYTPSTRSAGRNPQSVIAADLGGDRALELIVANQGGADLSVLATDGSERSYGLAPAQYFAGDWSRAVTAADFDGDGSLDLAMTLPSRNATRLLVNHGDATFEGRLGPNTKGAASAVAAGDLDGDGLPDLIIANDQRASISWFKNKGNASFEDAGELPVGGNVTALAVGDVDQDGGVDIAVATFQGSVMLLNRGGAFSQVTLGGVQYSPMSMRVKDIDDDGFLDVLTTNGDSAYLYFGDGQGAFTAPELVGAYFGATVADAGDFDGDGRTDIVLAAQNLNRVGLLRSLGARMFATPVELDSGQGPSSLATADIDGDGSLDLISASWYASSRGAHVDVFLNDGHGHLALPLSYFVAGNLHSMLVGQLDRDGRPDVVVAGVNAVSVMRNVCLPGTPPSHGEAPPNFDAVERSCAQHPLSLRLIDADYSRSLDRVVIASEAPNEVVIREPRSGAEQRVPLTSPPLAISVAPAGDTAVVLQQKALAWVDLSAARLIKTVPIDSAGEVVLADNYFVYLFSDTERFVYSIDLLNETASLSDANPAAGITLNAKRGVVYACSPVFGPVDIEEYAADGGRARYVRTSPFGLSNLMYPPLFSSVDGKRLFSATGAVFYAEPFQSRDMQLGGLLPGPFSSNFRFIGSDLKNQRIYGVQGGNTYLYGLLQSFEEQERWVAVYANADLSYLGKIPVPCRNTAQGKIAAYARFVFAADAGDRIYVITTTSTEAALSERWGLAVLDASGNAL